jgi:hypothetical protein
MLIIGMLMIQLTRLKTLTQILVLAVPAQGKDAANLTVVNIVTCMSAKTWKGRE